MSRASEFHTDKYAIEITNPSNQTVRLMEIFGENAADSTADMVKRYWADKPSYRVDVVQIQK